MSSYLLDAGWFFFAAWSVIILAVSWAAFSQDLFPHKTIRDLDRKPLPDRASWHGPELR